MTYCISVWVCLNGSNFLTHKNETLMSKDHKKVIEKVSMRCECSVCQGSVKVGKKITHNEAVIFIANACNKETEYHKVLWRGTYILRPIHPFSKR